MLSWNSCCSNLRRKKQSCFIYFHPSFFSSLVLIQQCRCRMAGCSGSAWMCRRGIKQGCRRGAAGLPPALVGLPGDAAGSSQPRPRRARLLSQERFQMQGVETPEYPGQRGRNSGQSKHRNVIPNGPQSTSYWAGRELAYADPPHKQVKGLLQKMAVKQGSIHPRSICPGQSTQESISLSRQKTQFPAEAELLPRFLALPAGLCSSAQDSRAPKSERGHESSLGSAVPRGELPGCKRQRQRSKPVPGSACRLWCLVFRAHVSALLFFRPTNVSSIPLQGKARCS